MTQNRARNLTLALALAAALAGCQRAAPPAQQAPPVVVANPLTREMVDWDAFSGRFEASKQVEVRARVGGYVQGVHFRDGQSVAKGQLLFTLDPRPAQAAADAARARAAQARADFERAEKLVAETAISQQEFDAARAALAQAESTAAQGALDLEFTRVTAPMAGLVSYRRVDAGNIVSGGNSLDPATGNVVDGGMTVQFSSQAYTSNGNISYNGWTVQITGVPAARDTFLVEPNAGGKADSRNMLALGKLQTTNILSGGTASYQGAYSKLVADVGVRANQVNINEAAQSQLLMQSQTKLAEASGVNLDEEASNLLIYQQAYLASSRVIQIAQKAFEEVLNIGR